MAEPDAELLDYFRLEAAELLAALRRGLRAEDGARPEAERIHELNRAAHSLKGAARLVECFAIGDLAHAMEDTLVLARDGARPLHQDEVDRLLKQTDDIEALLELGPDAPAPRSGSARDDGGSVRVSAETLEEIGRCAGEVVELGNRSELWLRRAQELRRALKRLERALPESEASAIRAQLASFLDAIPSALSAIRPLGRRLRTASLDARMVGLDDVLYRCEKTVRDTAAELGKQARLELVCEPRRIDRLVLQKIAEPIAHLLRNAVAHGIESPDERQRCGKPALGHIRLEIGSAPDALRVVVEDDGSGLDGARIRRAAGLELDVALGDTELAELIFRPGLSTHPQATPIAGRGVGLDAVRRAVQELCGEIAVRSEPGAGCRFELRLPANLDILDVFCLVVEGQDLLVPTRHMVRVVLAHREELLDHLGGPALLLDERPVPVYPLADLLALGAPRIAEGPLQLAVVRAGARPCALLGEAMRGRHQVVSKRLPARLAANPLLIGAATMADGRPGLLLSVEGVLARAEGRPRAIPGQGASRPVRRRVLVVDDSLTSRTLEKSLLRAAGYETRVARRGGEALELLERWPCDLAVLDFDMPDMNGLELSRRIRQRARFASLPMVMLSSHGQPDAIRQGLDAGMNAYLVKGQFDQATFLATIGALLSGKEVGT
jgi:two-component system, chemotaxis family, sensor kinase CheA